MEKHLQVNDLSHYTDPIWLWKKLSFELHGGRCLLLKGPNGVGKTTLIQILCGLQPATWGHIEWQVPFIGLQVATGLEPRLTAHQNLVAEYEMHTGKPLSQADFRRAASLWHLPHRALYQQKVGELSSGQQQQINLMRLTLHQRPTWLLDEPTQFLSETAQDTFHQLLCTHLESGGSAVLVSHQSALWLKECSNFVQTLHLSQAEPLTSTTKPLPPPDSEKGQWKAPPLPIRENTGRPQIRFKAQLRREMQLYCQSSLEWMLPFLNAGWIFFCFFCWLSPSEQGNAFYYTLAVAWWVAHISSLRLLFDRDQQNGVFLQLNSLGWSPPWWAWLGSKLLLHGTLVGLPLALISIGLEYTVVPLHSARILQKTLSVWGVGLPALTLWGSAGAALLSQLKSQHWFLSLLLFPFYMPLLLWVVALLESVLSPTHYVVGMAGLSLLSLTSLWVLPWFILQGCRWTTGANCKNF